MKRGPLTLLLLLALGAGLAFLLATPTGLAWLWGLRPAGLEAERLHGRLIGPLTLEGLTLPDGTRIARLDLDLAPAALLHGTLRLTRLHAQGITLPANGDGGTLAPPSLPTLPLALQVDRLLVADLRRDGRIILERLTARLELRPRGWRLEALELALPGATLSGSARIAGAPPHDLDGRLTWRLASDPPLGGETRLAGNLRRPRLDTTLAGALKGRVQAAIEGWHANEPRWRLEARLQSRDWQPPPALGGPLHTRLELRGTGPRGEGELQLDAPRLRLTSPMTLAPDALRLEPLRLQAPFDARGTLRLALDGTPHRLYLIWQDLDLPPLASPNGELSLEGRPDDYRFRIDARLRHPRLPLGRWQAQGHGDRRRLRLGQLTGEALGGRLEGQGELTLADSRPWRLHLTARGLDPATVDLGPGRLALDLDADGALAPLRLATRLTRLDGHWRGQPLSGQGRLERTGGDWHLQTLNLHLGETRLRLDGRWGRALAARLRLRSPRLADLHPGLNGRLRLQAQVQQAPDAPLRLQWELAGENLAWRGTHAARLQSRGQLRADGVWQATLDAHTLRLARLDLDRLRLDLDGHRRDHRLRIQAEATAGRLDARLHGNLDERARRWSGQVEDLRLDALQRRFQLQRPASLTLAHRWLRLDDLCLRAPDSGLCLGARHDPEENRIDLDLTHLPLALVRPWLPAPLIAQGTLHGHLRLRLPRRSQSLAVQATSALRGEGIRLRLPPAGEVPVEGLRLRGGIENGIARARLDLDIPGRARLQARLPRLTLDLERPERSRLREARLRLLVPRLEAWGVLLPAQYQAHGPLRLDARLDGPVRDPDLRLEVDGREAGVELGDWGVTLRDLALRAQGRPREAVDFQLDTRTDAPLRAQGRLRLAPWRLHARLQGMRVEVARRPDLHLFASPDLRLEAEAGRLTLGGELALPQGEVMPQQAAPPTQVVAEPSEDVVVIDGPTQAPPPAPRWETNLDLRLSLGERVFFQGYGLSGYVTGRLHLRRTADGLTLATGELTVREGTYDAYGQTLTIERGQLVFADSPLDNPAVDIVAVRRIEDIAVGLRLTGRLKKPQVTLFADPPMNETRILSYLLFGHAPGEASGPEAELLVRIAASLGLARGYLITRALAQRLGLEETRIERNRLVLGRRIGERLYLTYAIGLGAEPNLWVVRYRLGRNWELKAEAGAGYAADLFLTLDR